MRRASEVTAFSEFAEACAPSLYRTAYLMVGDHQLAQDLVQEALVKKQLLPADGVDGVFGPMTAELVKRFQKMANLDADGIVGVETWMVVNEVMTA